MNVSMNTIIKYNNRLPQMVYKLEVQNKDITDEIIKNNKGSTKNPKNNQEQTGSVNDINRSFELLTRSMAKSYPFSTSELPEEASKDRDATKKEQKPESNQLWLGNSEKGDIVLKMDATKKILP